MPSETNQPLPLDNPISRRLSRTFGARHLAWRLFFTCWLIFGLHFSTEIVREIYPAVALGDHLSFRVDEYAGLHPDIFEKEGYRWPQLELLGALVLDHRFGLFTSSPLLLLALAAPFVDRGSERRLPLRECAFTLLLFLGLWVFFSGSNYTRPQYNTGVR